MSQKIFKSIPGSGAIAGILWIAFAAAVAPASIYAVFHLPVSSLLSTAWRYVGIGLILPAICFIYGVILLARVLYDCFKDKINDPLKAKIYAWEGALFLPAAGIFLFSKLITQRRLCLAVTALLSSLSGLYFIIAPFFIIPEELMFEIDIRFLTVEFSGILCLVLLSVVLGIMQKEKKSAQAFFPALGILLVILSLIAYNFKLEKDIAKLRSGIILSNGQPLTVEIFKKVISDDFDYIDNPLRKLAYKLPHYCEIDSKGIISQEDLEKIKNFETESPGFAQAIEDFLKREPQNITYSWAKYGIYPDYTTFFCLGVSQAIRYLLGKIHANPTDKKLVFTVNDQIKKLIQWEFNLHLSTEMFSAFENELFRIKHLIRLMEYKEWSKTEISQLIGNAPLADYMRHINDLYCYFIISGETPDGSPAALNFSKKVFSKENPSRQLIECLKTRSFLYTHTYYKLNFKLYIEKLVFGYKLVSAGKAIPLTKFKNEKEIAFDMPTPYLYEVASINEIAAEEIIWKFLPPCDITQWAHLAAEIVEFVKTHGKLPNSLDNFPNCPKSYERGLPPRYIKNTDSFQLSTDSDKPLEFTLKVPVSRLLK